MNLCLSKLRIEPSEVELLPPELVNSVAFVRGAHMVVEYHSRSFSPLLPPFVGVLKAGTYRGVSEPDKHVETFLRDSEPPAHDKWDPAAIKLAENYKQGYQKELRQLYESLGSSATTLLGTNTPSMGRVPRRLAELLRGGKGGKTIRVERFSMIGKSLDRDKPDEISATFTLKRNAGSGEWIANCSIVLIDEQRIGRELHLSRVNAEALKKIGVTVNFLKGKSPGLIKAVEIVVPANLDSIDVEMASDIPVSKVTTRSMADVKVSYHQSERAKK